VHSPPGAVAVRFARGLRRGSSPGAYERCAGPASCEAHQGCLPLVRPAGARSRVAAPATLACQTRRPATAVSDAHGAQPGSNTRRRCSQSVGEGARATGGGAIDGRVHRLCERGRRPPHARTPVPPSARYRHLAPLGLPAHRLVRHLGKRSQRPCDVTEGHSAGPPASEQDSIRMGGSLRVRNWTRASTVVKKREGGLEACECNAR